MPSRKQKTKGLEIFSLCGAERTESWKLTKPRSLWKCPRKGTKIDIFFVKHRWISQKMCDRSINCDILMSAQTANALFHALSCSKYATTTFDWSPCWSIVRGSTKIKEGFLLSTLIMSLLFLPPFRFHSVRGSWDWAQDMVIGQRLHLQIAVGQRRKINGYRFIYPN